VAINVALAAPPGVLGDLVQRVLEREPGFRLTVRANDPTSAVRDSGPEKLHALVWCAAGDAAGAGAPAAARERPSVLVAISPDGRHASLHASGREVGALTDLSPERLVAAIRATTGERTETDA
jgi:hypothetical protein